MFEEIQEKSHEIGWMIPFKSLTACLSYRDNLYWVNIDLRIGALTLDNLLQIKKSNLPIKRLSFRTEALSDAMLEVIKKFSSTIEVLEIDYRNAHKNTGVSERCHKQTLIEFPKLKALFIDFSAVPAPLLQRFDLSSCSDSLKKLCLFGFLQSSDEEKVENQLIMKFVDSLKVLKNLESLTIGDRDICRKTSSIVHLKNLRTLDLRSMPSDIPRGSSLVKILPKLQNLVLPRDNLIDEMNSLKGKKLNYVGSHFERDFPEKLKQFAKNVGSAKDFPSYLKFMDFSSCFCDYTNKTFYLMEMLSCNLFPSWYLSQEKSVLLAGCEIRKIEEGILAHIMWDLFDVEYCVDAIIDYKEFWSRDFLFKVANVVTCLQISEDVRFKEKLKRFESHFKRLLQHQPLIDFKKGYVALNPNSSISQLYKRTPPVV